MQLISITCLIVAVVIQQPTANGKRPQPEHGEESPEVSCAIDEEVAPCSNSGITLEVSVGQAVNVTLQSTSHRVCNWTWDSSEDSTKKQSVSGKYRERAFEFLFRATDRHAGLATIHCRNASSNISVRVKLSAKPTMMGPSKPDLSIEKGEEGWEAQFVCQSKGYPAPVITWYSDVRKSSVIVEDVSSPSKSKPNSTESMLSSYTFLKNMVVCCASNSLGEECSLLYDYDLDHPESSPPLLVTAGQTLLLRCRSEDKFRWFLNGTEANVHLTELGSKYMYLNISDSFNGTELSCKASNNKIRSTKIHVLEKGFINVLELKEVNSIPANEESGFCFEATVLSFPLADCHWITPAGERLGCLGEEQLLEGKGSYKLCSPKPGVYKLQLENSDTSITKNVSLCVIDKPTLLLSQNGTSVNCVANSSQPWKLTWKICQFSADCQESSSSSSSSWKEVHPKTPPEHFDSEQYCHQTILSSVPSKDVPDHFLRCCIWNSAGEQCSEPIPIQNNQSTFFLLGIIAMLVVVIFLVTILFLCSVRRKKPAYQSQLQMIQMVGPSDNDYIYIDFRDYIYDHKWEFPRENLELGKELGSGAFGKVLQATAYGIIKPGVSVQVAVKMLKDKHQAVEREALMAELKMLSYIGHHANIVNLLGACTFSGPTYLIFQYCCNGDLLNYLKNNRERFHKSLTDAITKDRFTSLYHNYQPRQNASNYQHPPNPYVHMSAVKDQESVALLGQSPTSMEVSEGSFHVDKSYDDLGDLQEDDLGDLQEDGHQALTFGDLLCVSHQVARGMEFLSSKNCIHRDLAARNVLVTRGGRVKIGDFGLARDIENNSNYVVRGNARLPVKWMAPESIFKGIYTMQSDIWAYGILLWEIFSLGVTPYPGMKVDSHFYSLIEQGFQMEQPYYANESVYHMMRCCWALEPRARPCFSKLVVFIEKELSVMEEKIYLNVGEQNNNNSSMYQNTADVPVDSGSSQMSQSDSLTDERATQPSDSSGRTM